jgi:hypothetical protein
MHTPTQYITAPGGVGQETGVWDRAIIEGHLDIRFQNGCIAVHGINGVQLNDVLKVCADQVRALQRADPSRERAMVITKLDEALLWEWQRAEAANTPDKAAARAAGRSA